MFFYRVRSAGLFVFLSLSGIGCDSAEVKQCRDNYLTTHTLVQGVVPTDAAAVKAALESVTATQEFCEKAQLKEELKQLKGVRRKLESMSEYLSQYGNRKELSPEELDALVKSGDPGCPKGQAYNYRKTGKQVRCTGPQLVSMNWAEVESYFKGRDFGVTTEGSVLKVESGSESYSYHFSKVGDERPARCVDVFAAPGIPWEESVARFTGALPQRLKRGQPVKAKAGTFAIRHVDDETQAIYHLGECE